MSAVYQPMTERTPVPLQIRVTPAVYDLLKRRQPVPEPRPWYLSTMTAALVGVYIAVDATLPASPGWAEDFE